MNCDICHKDTTAGSHVNRGRYFEVHICPSCLMEIIKNFKNLRFLEDISISHEGTEAQ